MFTKTQMLAQYCTSGLPVMLFLRNGDELHCVVRRQIEGGDLFMCARIDQIFPHKDGFTLVPHSRLYFSAEDVLYIEEDYPLGTKVEQRPGGTMSAFNYVYPSKLANEEAGDKPAD